MKKAFGLPFSVLSFFLFVFFLASCKKEEATKIKIGILDGPSAISFIRMIDEPPIIGGKQVAFITKSEPLQIQSMLIKNELDFAILPTVSAVNLFNKGIDFRIIACPIWGTLYVLSNDPKIRSFSDLEGKRISVFGQGTTPDVVLQLMLDKVKIPDVGIDYAFQTNAETAQALRAGKTRIAVVSEPLVSLLITENKDIHIVGEITCEDFIDGYDRNIFAQSSFLVSADFVEQNNILIPYVANSYATSCNFVNEQTDEAAKLLVKHHILPSIEIAKTAIPLCNIEYIAAFAADTELYRYISIYNKTIPECIGGKIPPHKIIYSSN
ncbi:MAG: transporter substrate-binding domain-containing protein [Prevotellaceae bacterium]|jgi:NitT/TauT family transport system substrate-binding protein|nr:transporter substrate-binding domain-containing protein [Prevotellaceae bacterium]